MSTPAQKMVSEQLVPHGVTDERVLRAMSEIPREEFISPRLRRHAYDDRALGIQCGQTISQPLVVALMTQAVAPKPDEIALEVGAGSGYQAAVLGRLCRKLITLEREPALAEHASATLRRLGFDNVEVAVADGSLGWPKEAPYDIILVAAAARQVPAALIEQLAEGGRMVIPVDVAPDEPQDLRLYLKQAGEVSYRPLRTG
jgi:protein-L-isoaspartate(D-aspartate) O-methyltransferase